MAHSTTLRDYEDGFSPKRRFVGFIPKINLTNLKIKRDKSGYLSLLAEVIDCHKILKEKGWDLSLSQTFGLGGESLRNFIMAGRLGLLPKGEKLDRADLFTKDYPEGGVHIPTFYFSQFCCGENGGYSWFTVGVNDYR